MPVRRQQRLTASSIHRAASSAGDRVLVANETLRLHRMMQTKGNRMRDFQLELDLGRNETDNDAEVIVICPKDASVRKSLISKAGSSFNLLGGPAVRIHRLPTGDNVYSHLEDSSESTFTLGGSENICGSAVVVGRRRNAKFTSPKCSVEIIQQLVNFR